MAEPLNATFFAFRKREPSGVMLRASIAFVIVAVVLIAAFAALFWGSLAPVITWYGTVVSASISGDTAAVQAAGFPVEFFGVFGGLLLWLFPFYVLCAAYEAACLRWMIHGEVQGFMGLALDAPTWRVWGCYWMWLLLNFAFSIVMSILFGVVIGILAVNTGGDPAATFSAMMALYVIQYALMGYFAIRFAPGAATTIAARRFAFLDAWKVSSGRFGALLGSFALLWFMYAVFSVVIGVAWFAFALGGAAIDFAALADPSRAEAVAAELFQAYFQSLLRPESWAVIGALWAVGSIGAVVFYVATYGVNARAAQAALEEGKIQST